MTEKAKRTFVPKMCSFTPEQLAEVEAYAERRRQADPGARFSATDAVRVLIAKGLAAEKDAGR